MKIKWSVLTALVLVITSVSVAESKTRAASQIRKIDFLNYSYQSSAVCSEDAGIPKTVKVSNGTFKDGDKFYITAKDEIGYGDVNGDGIEDAVVQIRCGSTAGTFRAFEIHAYTFKNGRVKLLARLDSNDVERDYKATFTDGVVFYPGETAPKIQNGHLMAQALTDGSFASPENVATFDYKLSKGKFVLTGKPTRTKKAY